MARYSRRRGPVANLELTVAAQIIPELTLTRQYDDGELLIHVQMRIFNATVAAFTPLLTIEVDGAQIHPRATLDTVDPATRGALNALFLHPISAGTHTITVLVAGVAAVGDVVELDTAQLIVIQLPLWDRDTDFT